MAIPLFVKVTPYAAKKMQLEKERFKTADGNYLLRQMDFMVFGPLSRLEEYAAKVGGVILRDSEAAANQRGETNTPLPAPTDPEWAAPEEKREEREEREERDESEAPEEGNAGEDEDTTDAGEGVSDDDDAEDEVEPETDEAGEGEGDE